MSKVLILDPSCVSDNRSHNINAVMGHARTFISAGYDVILGTNMECKMENNGYRNHAVFSYTIYDDHRNRRTGLFKRWLSRNYYRNLVNETTEMVRKILDNCNISSNDHVFVPTTDWILFQSLLNLHSVNEKFPFLHFLLMYEDGNWMTGGYPYAKITGSLKNRIGQNGKIFIYTETTCHAQHLEPVLGIRPGRYPYPTLPFEDRIGVPRSGKISVGALGGGRKDKGYGLLPDIINRFNVLYPDNNVVFVIQEARSEDRLSFATKLLKEISNVTLLKNELARSEYEEYFLKCDITLFPYNSRVYQCRGSGIINEAVANAKPIICPQGTALAEALTVGNGMYAGTVEEFANSVIHIIRNLDQYRINAKNARDRYLQELYNNPVITNIRNSLNMRDQSL